jgi:dCTP deaminase
MSVLTDLDILELVNTTQLIVGFEKASLEGASYDLRLGHQYVKHGTIETLTDEHPTLVVAPGDFLVLRTLEELNLPLNIIGHNGIMSPWAKRGLVSLFSPQIDPGFEGFLVVPIFNAGDSSISVNYKQKIFTVEFVKTTRDASYSWSARHGRQDRLEVPIAPSQSGSHLPAIAALRKEMASMAEQIKLMELGHGKIGTQFDLIQDRMRDVRERRNLRIGKWTLIVALVTLLTGVVLGILGSDWVRENIFGKSVSHGFAKPGLQSK